VAKKPWLEVVALLWWDACMHRDNPVGTTVPVLSFGILDPDPARCGGIALFPEISAQFEPKDRLVVPKGMNPRVISLAKLDKPPEFQRYEDWLMGFDLKCSS